MTQGNMEQLNRETLEEDLEEPSDSKKKQIEIEELKRK
jgi:hypothetical protein